MADSDRSLRMFHPTPIVSPSPNAAPSGSGCGHTARITVEYSDLLPAYAYELFAPGRPSNCMPDRHMPTATDHGFSTGIGARGGSSSSSPPPAAEGTARGVPAFTSK